LWLILGVILLATTALLAEWFCQPPKGTLSPPPGPHQAGDVWMADLGGKTMMAMVWCPPGKFLMGSPVTEVGRSEDEIQHEVVLTKGFWIGKYEVTQGQWRAVMGVNPSSFPQKEVVRWKIWKWQIPVWRKDILTSRWSLPVETVTWTDSLEFCQNIGIGFRLPREAEWEYACRAGTTGMYAGTGILSEMGWFDGNSDNTHPVGRKKPNAWGLYDMHGNVWEFCQDWSETYPAGAVIDPVGPTTGEAHICRGGCYANYGRLVCRSACRCNDAGSSSLSGFRLAFIPISQP
jgi:formylglycine-generating enzyme required for sulfatase activity